TLYIDVGGGSTELSLFSNEKFISSKSFNIGTIRFLFDKVLSSEWLKLEEWLKSLPIKDENINCICTGGNISAITKLFGNKDYTVNNKQIENAIEELEKYSFHERMQVFSLRPDRADVIIPAAKIFNNILKWGNIDTVIAPQLGLADGLAIELYKNYIRENRPNPLEY
nr:exopolyphosphatase [Bacteroidales bacterium]